MKRGRRGNADVNKKRVGVKCDGVERKEAVVREERGIGGGVTRKVSGRHNIIRK